MNLLLVGSPNTGKTTLFNTLTKSEEHTGNWHGVTVEEKKKAFVYGNANHILSDLPGTYGLSPFSLEEEVTLERILKCDDQIINICQSSDLERNLILTLELIELGKSPIVFINQIDGDDTKINTNNLEKCLGTKVALCSATQKKCKSVLCEKITKVTEKRQGLPSYLKNIGIEKIEEIIYKNAIQKKLPTSFCAIKIFERDQNMADRLELSDLQKQKIEEILPYNSISIVAEKRNSFAKKIYSDSTFPLKSKINISEKINKTLVSKLWSFPIFFVIFALIFALSFFFLGAFISEFLEKCIEQIKFVVSDFFASFGSVWLQDLIENGIFGGALSLVSFCGQVTLLFLFLAVIEDTGYFSRIAFIWEDFLQMIGLNGRSVYSILLGFGCSTSAMLTARNASNKTSKIKTVLIIPFMSCSAKLPIFLLICSAFFKNSFMIVLCLLLISLIIGIFVCMFLSKTILKSKESEFIFELAPLRMPSFKRVCKLAFTNIKNFFVRIFGVVLISCLILWFVQKHSFSLVYLPQGFEGSILQKISSIVSPIFSPLGLGSAAIVAAIFSGLVAKEVVVSSIALFNFASISAGLTLSESIISPQSAIFFTPTTAITFLVFCLLYSPCVAAIAMCGKECGRKWAVLMVAMQTIVAYICALSVKLMLDISFAWIAIPLTVIILLLFGSIFWQKKCKNCDGLCKKCTYGV
ncbi:MAG: ferrous iron transport protein B [Clostridia bacterium]